MKVKDVIDLENRKKIYDYINKYPGVHLSGLFKNLDMSNGTIRYHVKYMEERSLISVKKDEGYNRFYPKDEFCSQFKEILSVIRRKTPRNIVLTILVHTGITQKEIADQLEKHPSTIASHIKELIEKGIIEQVPVVDGKIQTKYKGAKHMKCSKIGREIIYCLTDPYIVYDLLVVHKDKLLDDGTTKSILEFFEFTTKKGLKEFNTVDKRLENAIETFYKIFPPPFYS